MLNNRNGYKDRFSGIAPNSEIKQEIKQLDERITETESRLDDLSRNVVTENVISDNINVNQKLTTDTVDAASINSNNFSGNKADIVRIDSDTVNTDVLNANTANVKNLNVENRVTELSVGTLHTDTFNPSSISTNSVDSGSITSGSASISGNITAATSNITSSEIGTATIQNATIENANVHTLSNDTITTNTISANGITTSTISADDMRSITSEFTNSVIENLKVKKIAFNGQLNADPALESYYSIDIPNYDNALIQLSSVYSTNDKWSISIMKARNTAYIEISQTIMEGVLDISYDAGKLRIRAKSDGIINYSLIANEENPASITVSPLGDHYMPYFYVPQKLNTYTLLGYDDATSEFYIPGTLKLYMLQAEYVQYEEVSTKIMRLEKLELPLTHDQSGSAINYTFGNPRDYVAVSDDGLVTEFHTPVETAPNGILSNSTNLIAEKAITEYNGTKNSIDPVTEQTVTEYPITELGDTTTVHGKLNVQDDTTINGTVSIKGDLYVDGTSHVVEEETVTSQSDTIVLRTNNSSSLGNKLSGLVVNKYNGTDDLGVVVDSTGTLRIGTGTGTDTTYATITYDASTNKWYTDIEDPTTEVTPNGNLTSWATKTEEPTYTTYTQAVFTVIDKTSLQPVLTRDESSDMTDGQLICWNSTANKSKTTNCVADTVTFACCVNVEENVVVDGTACVCTSLSTPLIASNRIDICTPSTTPGGSDGGCVCGFNATFDNNVLVCGDFRVCGSAIIHGLTSDCVAVQSNCCDHEMYPSFVCRNNTIGQQAELLYTDGDLHYNPDSDTLTVPNVEAENIHTSCSVKADTDVTAGCVITSKIYSPQTSSTNTDTCILSHKADDTNAVTAKSCSDGNFYQNISNSSTNSGYKVPFTSLTGNTTGLASLSTNDSLTYNPSTGCLYTPGINTSRPSCMTGTLIVETSCSSGPYGEGIRINSYNCGTSMLTIGSTGNDGLTCGFAIHTTGSNEDKLYINYHNICQPSYFVGNNNGTVTWVGDVCATNITGTNISGTTATIPTINTNRLSFGYCGGINAVVYGTQPAWGNQTGTAVASWEDCTSGAMYFRRDNPTCGQLSMIIDGTVYVDEGRYSVIHSGNIACQTVCDSCYLQGFSPSVNAYANTIAMRDGNGYLFAAIFNDSYPVENINLFSSPKIMFKSADGYIRNTYPSCICVGCANIATELKSDGTAIVHAEYGNELNICGASNSWINYRGGTCLVSIGNGGGAGGLGTLCAGCIIATNGITSSSIINSTGAGLVLGSKSISIGQSSWTGEACCGIAIGYCASTYSNDGGVAIGACSFVNDNKAVSIGCSARGSGNSITIGGNAQSCAGSSIVIGHDSLSLGGNSTVIGACACSTVSDTIAIGTSARTYTCGNASLELYMKTANVRYAVVSWRCNTLSCDIFNAIYSAGDLSWVGGCDIACTTIYNSTMGAYSDTAILFYRYDKNESPRNIDFYNTAHDIVLTVFEGCTATVSQPGMIGFLISK